MILQEGPKEPETDSIDPDRIVRVLHAIVAEKGYMLI